ncbi:uncharacterized protein DDB_G0283697-like [Anoplophora glabripennis]|uniref:uncharacterized protein DDB_G0283697-like n=1 Tax=Anoplophora glabripennis TaxID=217634 RepID=UPI000C7715AE|nr:uncharacterized protein DDB_G0283697-like [Anoplophora glabripennis]
MLLQRSILSQVCILLVLCLVKAQYDYDKEEKKEVKEEEEDDRDYAKIFAEETSAALTAATSDEPESPKQADFVTPTEFETFFKPAHIFGESNDKPVKSAPENKKKEHLQSYESKREDYPSYLDDGPLKDFFEESERRQQKLQKQQSNKDEEVIPPGPSYVSQQVPAKYSSYEDDEEDKSASASEDVNNKQKSSDEPDIEEGIVEKNEEDYKLPIPFAFTFKSNKPKVNYDTGKSSSTVSQYPTASGYDKPAASSQERTNKKQESAPYDEQESSPYEDIVNPYEKEGPNPYEEQASTPYGAKIATPYEKQEKSNKKQVNTPYDEQESVPYEDRVNPYEKDGPNPYEELASTPYGKQVNAPYEKQEKTDKKQESAPYDEQASTPYGKQVDNDYEKKKSSPYEKYSFKPSEEYAAQNSKYYDSKVKPYNPTYKKNSEPKHEGQSSENSFKPSEEYAAQNSKYYDSKVKPYNPTYKKSSEPKHEGQSSENTPSHLQGKGCRKVASNNKDDMNCFICENPKTNAKYTQCSFSTQQKPVDYYEGNSAQYSMQNKPEPNSYRYKRSAENAENDPYTYVRNRARKDSHDGGIPSDYSAGFQYEPEHYDESKPELTYSEQHSEELKKNPDNCKKVDKDGMTCTICKDPKSGGNFEQCSYASKPKEKKFAYVTEKKFDNDEPAESQIIPQSQAAEANAKENADVASKKNAEFLEQFQSRVNEEKAPKKGNEEGREDHHAKSSEKKEKKNEEGYEFPSHFVKNVGSPNYDHSAAYKGASSDNVDTKKKSDYFTDFDEYHFKYFPEFSKQQQAKQESRQQPVRDKYEVPVPEATKQNVESVLAEFTKKDRSNCKKAEKKGMTCYLCVDKNNIQNEECMYVQESKPETKHIAYHEAKATEKAKPAEPEQNVTEAPKQETKLEPVVTETKNKYFFKNVPNPPAPLGLEAAASEQVSTFVRYDPDREKRSANKKEKKVKEDKEPKPDESAYESERIDDKADPTIKTPEEFNVAPGEGAFSDETKAVYSKELGVQLPKYMLEKSEFEKEFDAFSGAF